MAKIVLEVLALKSNKNKWVVSATTAALVASAIVPVASAASFSDIEKNDHKDAILALAEAGIVSGYTDGTFKPNAVVTRGNVTKLLGKWLVSEGYEIPEDFEKEVRFTDLPVTSVDQELVKYAALVKDEGVFKGSNDKLMQANNMTREQMALVLVRAINTVYGVDLVADYKAANFESKITDLEKATANENREAITALEYAELTTVTAFNPKNSLTRGQFASFLNRAIENLAKEEIELTVKTVTVTDATTLEVTLSDDKKHTVTLPTALPKNKETEVVFEIDGNKYSAKVTYEVTNVKVATVTVTNATTINAKLDTAELGKTVEDFTVLVDGTEVTPTAVVADATGANYTLTIPTLEGKKGNLSVNGTAATYDFTALKVESVSAINGAQLVVKFTQPINVDDVVTTTAGVTTLNASVLTVNDSAVTGSTYVASVSEDKKTVTILANTPITNWDGYYTVKLLDGAVKSADGKFVPEAQFTINAEDKTAPTVSSVTKTSATTYRVNFSEPIKNAGSLVATYKASGKSATADLNVVSTNMAKGYIDVQITGANVPNGAVINLSWLGVQDYSGNLANPNPLELEITKGEKDGVAPTVTSIKTTALNKFEIEFSEEVNLAVTQIKIGGNALADGTTTGQTPAQAKLVQDKDNKKKYTVTLADVKSSGDIISVSIDKGVTDLSGEVLSSTADYVKAIQFNNDVTAPTLVSSSVKKDVSGKEFLHLVFDENVTLSTPSGASAKMVYNGLTSIGTLTTVAPIAVSGTDNKEWKIELGHATTQFTSTTPSAAAAALVNNATYTFDLVGLATDLAGNAIASKSVTFNRGTDTSAVTQYVTSIVQGSTNSEISVNFANNVDLATATNTANYAVQGAVVEKAEVIAGTLNRVLLTIKDGSNTQTGARNVTVSGVKTAAGENMTKAHTQAVTLKENVAPKFTATLTANNTIELKFSEAVTASTASTGVIDTNDFVVYVDDVAVAATVATVANGVAVDTVTVTLTSALTDLSKKVEVAGKAGNDVVDAQAVAASGAVIVGNKLGTSKVLVSK